MNVVTFVFSGTGNTRWAADELHRAILDRGHHSRVHSIEEELDIGSVLQGADLAGVAFPVYLMGVPGIMLRFLGRMDDALAGKGPKPFFVLTTAGYVNGCGPREAVRRFTPGTVTLRGYLGVKMPNNVCTPANSEKALPAGETEARLEKARTDIGRLAAALTAGRKSIAPGLYPFMAPFRKKWYAFARSIPQKLSIHPDTCTRCMRCAAECPTGSIVEKDGVLVVLPACTACMRCYNHCPTASIWYEGQYADPSVYPRYRGPKNSPPPRP